MSHGHRQEISDADVVAAEEKLNQLRAQLLTEREKHKDTSLIEAASSSDQVAPVAPHFHVRRQLKGHLDKVYSLSWSHDSRQVVSAAQDGSLIVWDAWEGVKTHRVGLESRWVLCCSFSPSGHHVASGGLDNNLSVYELGEEGGVGIGKLKTVLSGHDGYVSSCQFVDQGRIITSSGDTTAILWDIEKKSKLLTFAGHSANVNSLSVSSDMRLLLTGGNDKFCRVWDLRDGKIKHTYGDHTSDVNSVSFFPNDFAFGTACEDTVLRLFDLRSDQCISTYSDEGLQKAAHAVCFSKSGRLIFGGYEDENCHVFDTLTGTHLAALSGHNSNLLDDRISALGVSPDGQALVTGSWNKHIRVYTL